MWIEERKFFALGRAFVGIQLSTQIPKLDLRLAFVETLLYGVLNLAPHHSIGASTTVTGNIPECLRQWRSFNSLLSIIWRRQGCSEVNLQRPSWR